MSKKKDSFQKTLSEKEAKKVIAKLADEIRHHQYLYYVKNRPEISDFDFDQLFRKLQDLEEEFPQFKDSNSPTLVVGSDLDKDFEKYQHKLPVLSLINTYSEDELLDWVHKTDPDGIYSVEWKIDGASIVLYYENGMLKNGVTRGSGGIGDDVTDNIRTIRNIPLRLSEAITIYLRGEVFMTFKDFEEFNEFSSGKYANPRNLSAGSIKQKNSANTAKRPLRIFTYDAMFPEVAKKFKTHREILSKLEKLTFPIPPDTVFVTGSKIAKTIEEFKKKKILWDFRPTGL